MAESNLQNSVMITLIKAKCNTQCLMVMDALPHATLSLDSNVITEVLLDQVSAMKSVETDLIMDFGNVMMLIQKIGMDVIIIVESNMVMLVQEEVLQLEISARNGVEMEETLGYLDAMISTPLVGMDAAQLVRLKQDLLVAEETGLIMIYALRYVEMALIWDFINVMMEI